jgi:hypothetical protein
VAAMVLSMPKPTSAMTATIDKGKSDCSAAELGITLTYSQDDTTDADLRDYFQLEIYDNNTGGQLVSIKESITHNQSPFFWQTGRLTGAIDPRSLYRIELWDLDAGGNKLRRIERVFLQCSTQNMWRDTPPQLTPPPTTTVYPAMTCTARVPIWTTNRAPENGAVIFQWAYGSDRSYQEFHISAAEVKKGDTFDLSEVEVPCGVYLRLYFQPDSNKLVYYMPSQYWPHDVYGTPTTQGQVGPIYHTFFPLNGPNRYATTTPTPKPTVTPTVTATP